MEKDLEENLKEIMGKIQLMEEHLETSRESLRRDNENHEDYDRNMKFLSFKAEETNRFNRLMQKHKKKVALLEKINKIALKSMSATVILMIISLTFAFITQHTMGYIALVISEGAFIGTVLFRYISNSEFYKKSYALSRVRQRASENLSEYQKRVSIKEKLSSAFLDEDEKNFLLEEIGTVTDNLEGYEKQVWQILQSTNPQEDTDYISELRESFYPKVYVPEGTPISLKHLPKES